MLHNQLPSSRYNFFLREKSSPQADIKMEILNILQEDHYDFLFLGSFGRKGEKSVNQR